MDSNVMNSSQGEILTRIRENYLSVALGLLVFLVAITLIFRSAGEITKQSAKNQNEAQSQTQGTRYTVKIGESVSSIARDQLGSMDYTDEIVELNNLENPDRIEVGQEILLPEIARDEQAEDVVDEEEVTEENDGVINQEPAAMIKGSITGNTYTVQKGDYLMDIARRAYGNEGMYTRIMEANNIWNPNYIEAGMVLQLPR